MAQHAASDQQLGRDPAPADYLWKVGTQRLYCRSDLGKPASQHMTDSGPFAFGPVAKAVLLIIHRYPAGNGRIVPDGKWPNMLQR